jgi:hypothetical protein
MALSRINSQSIADGTVIASDIADGSITSDKIVSVSNTAISGLIQAAQIGSVSNTAISGLIQAAQIGSANASVIDAGTLAGARLPTGSVLQVVSATDTGTFATTSTSFVGTGLTASITPSSASNKILVLVHSNIDSGTSSRIAFITLFRGATNLGHSTEGFGGHESNGGYIRAAAPISFLDSPNTTSSVTYEFYVRSNSGSIEGPPWGSMTQSIVLLEIAA